MRELPVLCTLLHMHVQCLSSLVSNRYAHLHVDTEFEVPCGVSVGVLVPEYMV